MASKNKFGDPVEVEKMHNRSLNNVLIYLDLEGALRIHQRHNEDNIVYTYYSGYSFTEHPFETIRYAPEGTQVMLVKGDIIILEE